MNTLRREGGGDEIPVKGKFRRRMCTEIERAHLASPLIPRPPPGPTPVATKRDGGLRCGGSGRRGSSTSEEEIAGGGAVNQAAKTRQSVGARDEGLVWVVVHGAGSSGSSIQQIKVAAMGVALLNRTSSRRSQPWRPKWRNPTSASSQAWVNQSDLSS